MLSAFVFVASSMNFVIDNYHIEYALVGDEIPHRTLTPIIGTPMGSYPCGSERRKSSTKKEPKKKKNKKAKDKKSKQKKSSRALPKKGYEKEFLDALIKMSRLGM